MARLSAALLLFGLLGSAVVSASPYDQEEQNRDATCDVGEPCTSAVTDSCIFQLEQLHKTDKLYTTERLLLQ